MGMAKISISLLLFAFLLLPSSLSTKCNAFEEEKYVLAIFVFGDSNFDVGNNDNLNMQYKANYLPYGIDIPQVKGCRYTNGLKIPEFYAQWFGLQSPPAYLHINITNTTLLNGFNYASGSAGTLNETHFGNAQNLPLGTQLDYFRETVEKYLSRHFENNTALANYLSKSIFLIDTGLNDISHNNATNRTFDENRQFNNELMKQLGIYIQEMYELGARKFVVYELGPPRELSNQIIDGVYLDYNDKLAVKLQELRNALEDAIFVEAKIHDLLNDVMTSPNKYGFSNSRDPCCPIENDMGFCRRNIDPCIDRSKYVYFDGGHFTEAMYKILAEKCFGENGFCVPMNLKELALR